MSQAKEIGALLSPNVTTLAYAFSGTFSYAGSTDVTDGDDALSGLTSFSKITDMQHVFEQSGKKGCQRAKLRVLASSLPACTTVAYAFASSSVPYDSNRTLTVSMKLTAESGVDASYMFYAASELEGPGNGRVKLDFSNSDFSGVTKAHHFLSNIAGNMSYFYLYAVTMPENFLSHCYIASNFASNQYSMRCGDKEKVWKFPKGFMQSPWLPSATTKIDISYMLAYRQDLKSIDYNSDFIRSPIVKSSGEAVENPNISAGNIASSSTALKCLILRFSWTLPYSATLPKSNTEVAIFVPSALVNTYKAATNWTTRADKIFAVEDYTTDGTIDGEFDYDKAGITLS